MDDAFYTEQERQIFGPFNNGRDMVHVDPMRVERRLLLRLDGDINKVLDQHRSEDIHISAPATDQLIDAAVYAFDLAMLDPKTGEGLTELAVIQLLDLFFTWLKKKEKPVEPTPTPPPSMEQAFLERAGFPLKSFTPSGSTCHACEVRQRGPSNVELTTPRAPEQFQPTFSTVSPFSPKRPTP